MGLSGAERQRRYIDRLKAAAQAKAAPDADGAALKAARHEIAQLKAELAREKGYNLNLKQHLALADRIRAEEKAAGADTAIAGREKDRQIDRLKRTVQELRAKVRHLTKHYEEDLEGKGVMTRAAYAKIVRCLHPDQRADCSAAEIDEACGLLTGWHAAARKRDADERRQAPG